MASDKDGNDDAVIHLRVPRDLKNRWVTRSHASGKKLTDWIVERVEAEQASVDEAAGMAWWNDLSEPMRASWLREVEGSDGSVAAAWTEFKRGK